MPTNTAIEWATAKAALIGMSNSPEVVRLMALSFDGGRIHLLHELNAANKHLDVANMIARIIKTVEDDNADSRK